METWKRLGLIGACWAIVPAAAETPDSRKAILEVGGKTIGLDVFGQCSTDPPALIWAVTFYPDEPGTSDLDAPRVNIVLSEDLANVTYYAGGSEPEFAAKASWTLSADGIVEVAHPAGSGGSPFVLKLAC